MILLWTIAAILVLILLAAFICFYLAFFVPKHGPIAIDDYSIPEGEIYEVFRDQMVGWMKEVRAMPHEDVYITSFDGLKLHGRYYEYAPGAPMELMFHGYRGNADRDLCGGVQRCFALKRSALVVDQRASAGSDGNVITFGIKEHRDCRAWVDFAVKKFGPDVKIILTGISMGASTVLMAAGEPLPAQVKGVLADCGFSSAKAIIHKVIRQLKLPPKLVYPFIRLGAILYGGFDPECYSAVEAVKHATLPTIFFHGADDDFVPAEMSQENFDACAAKKELVTIDGAGHGLSYPVDPEGYLQALRDFFGPELSAKE
ncbi:MAG: alpha/beta hydrolase [Oscillospiraceae bacterium]|nr:alpha/beta hydrolase [Oscillospiraceae bacterium]